MRGDDQTKGGPLALRTCLACSIAVLGTVLALGGPAAAQGTAPSSVPVTVYDGWMEPYTSYGRAQAGGAVIVFDQAPLGPDTRQSPAATSGLDAAAPGPVTVIGAPLETSAGPDSSASSEPSRD